MSESEQTYKIVRFYQDDNVPSEVIDTGLSLEAVQAHCNHPTTRGEGWFDGYEAE